MNSDAAMDRDGVLYEARCVMDLMMGYELSPLESRLMHALTGLYWWVEEYTERQDLKDSVISSGRALRAVACHDLSVKQLRGVDKQPSSEEIHRRIAEHLGSVLIRKGIAKTGIHRHLDKHTHWAEVYVVSAQEGEKMFYPVRYPSPLDKGVTPIGQPS